MTEAIYYCQQFHDYPYWHIQAFWHSAGKYSKFRGIFKVNSAAKIRNSAAKIRDSVAKMRNSADRQNADVHSRQNINILPL
jgi:hypothetical protein